MSDANRIVAALKTAVDANRSTILACEEQIARETERLRTLNEQKKELDAAFRWLRDQEYLLRARNSREAEAYRPKVPTREGPYGQEKDWAALATAAGVRTVDHGDVLYG